MQLRAEVWGDVEGVGRPGWVGLAEEVGLVERVAAKGLIGTFAGQDDFVAVLPNALGEGKFANVVEIVVVVFAMVGCVFESGGGGEQGRYSRLGRGGVTLTAEPFLPHSCVFLGT